jgi:hypothetical protein
MKLGTDAKRALRDAIRDSFSEAELDAFLITDFGGQGLPNYVGGGNTPWPVRVSLFVQQLHQREEVQAFLELLAGHPGPSQGGGGVGPNPTLRQRASEILRAFTPPAAGSRPCFVGGRRFIDRELLWPEIESFANSGAGNQRVLLIDGERGTGKSHSKLLIREWARVRGRYIEVDFAERSSPAEAPVAELTAPIVKRLELVLARKFDDLAQEARDIQYLGETLVAALEQAERQADDRGDNEPWWLLVDGLNLVRVSDEIVGLIMRLVLAIDKYQLQNLWLVLIGLEPVRLTGDLPTLVRRNSSNFPDLNHVKSWLCQLGANRQPKLEDDPALQPILDKLRGLVGPSAPRDHSFWPPVYAVLDEACAALRLPRS